MNGDEQAWGVHTAPGDGARIAAAAISRVSRPPQPRQADDDGAHDAATALADAARRPQARRRTNARQAQVEAMFPISSDPGVFSWMDAADATRTAAMQRLDRFVEWLCAVFAMHEVLTPCWSRHPAVVFELWALERHFTAACIEGDNKAEVARWLNQLGATRVRLNTEWRARDCEYGHADPVAEDPARVAARRAHYAAHFWPTGDVPEPSEGGHIWQRWTWPPTDEALIPIAKPVHTRTAMGEV